MSTDFYNRPITYDWASFTLDNGETDYDVATEVAALFSNVPLARHVVIFHNQEIGLRFNSTLLPKITLGISRSPFQSPNYFLDVTNILLSNASGTNATIEIFLW